LRQQHLADDGAGFEGARCGLQALVGHPCASTVRAMPAPAVDRELLDLAVAVAHRAGCVAAERFFAADFATRTKQDGTDVIDVDLAVEELIRTELLRHAPDDEIYGEAPPGHSQAPDRLNAQSNLATTRWCAGRRAER